MAESLPGPVPDEPFKWTKGVDFNAHFKEQIDRGGVELARRDGQKARRRGDVLESCPHAPNTPEACAWMQGWEE